MLITTIGIWENGKVYAFAETCWECGEFLAIEGFRNCCYRCV